MLKLSKYPHGGFTLIELLVVVLIIGILAAIALPQYKRAVGKAKLASIKNAVDSIVEAEERYYLVNNEYTEDLRVLDIENVGYVCYFTSVYATASCEVQIFGIGVHYKRSTANWRRCVVYSRNENDTANQVCKEDTGHNAIIHDENSYIYYNY